MEDVHEPLEQYSTHFQQAHRRHTAEYFEELVHRSGVDEQANIETVRQLRELEQQASSAGTHEKWLKIARGVLIALALWALLYVYANYFWAWLLAPICLFTPALIWLHRLIQTARSQLQTLQQACDTKRASAWGQMAALNRLFDWDIAGKLVHQTVPRIEFDRYFTNGRMTELVGQYGWNGVLGDDYSIVFSHSGVLNGNPFVLARALNHWMGSKVYRGSLSISWTEQVHGADGKWHTETRHETLQASIERPYPEYAFQTFIVYGNEAAPDLEFSRRPSKLSKLEDGLFDTFRKNRAIKKLEKKSRDLSSGNSFAVMSNREFDALFDATDRNHEVQFRLLFTPLAQQEMLKLLKDQQHGYGDDFAFDKRHMINVVEPEHMRRTDIGCAPEKFCGYELAQVRDFFNAYHNDFFRSFYFGIAPLLAIPLYQQHRSHSDIYRDTYAQKSCFWEHEAIANYHGEAQFNHPECVTRSILKTHAQLTSDGTQQVRVTANGYSSTARVEYVVVGGGDGHSHRVPVHWQEYFEVQRSTDMLVQEAYVPSSGSNATSHQDAQIAMSDLLQQRGVDHEDIILRRAIHSAVLRR